MGALSISSIILSLVLTINSQFPMPQIPFSRLPTIWQHLSLYLSSCAGLFVVCFVLIHHKRHYLSSISILLGIHWRGCCSGLIVPSMPDNLMWMWHYGGTLSRLQTPIICRYCLPTDSFCAICSDKTDQRTGRLFCLPPTYVRAHGMGSLYITI